MPDRAIHLAIYLPSLSGGGAERVMVTLANGFAELGHKVDLVLASAEGPYLTEVSHLVRIVDLRKGRVLASLLPLTAYLRREKPAAMLSALDHANITAIVARILAQVRTRLVISQRNSLSARSRMWKLGLVRRLMRLLYPLADSVIAVSKAMEEELAVELGLRQCKITSIPNPVDLVSLEMLAQSHPKHTWFELRDAHVILAVGRLEPQKDYQTLLEAVAALRKQRQVKLIVLGEGSQRKDLEELISVLGLNDAVELLGFVQNPFAWMKACDLFVLSSRYEGFPNVLVQAMACGAKVISTDCPTGPFEILEGGRWGHLVPVGDVGALAGAMAEALDNSQPPCVKRRAEVYNINKVLAAYLDRLVPMSYAELR